MSYIIDKAKEIFEKVKPVLMSETNSDPVVQESAPDITQENTEILIATSTETMTEQPAREPKAGALSLTTAVINGAGVGLLLGALLGLSISPVVSGVIGTISGLLAVLLGLSEKYINPLKSVRIGAFGIFCVAGIILGMYIRTNKGLLPSRQKMMQEYTAVGFSKEEARDFIAYREFGLVPSGWTGKQSEVKGDHQEGTSDSSEQTDADQPVENAGVSSVKPVTQSSARQFANPNQSAAELSNVLYSSEINATECYKLNLANSSQSVLVIRNTFERAGGTWKELAKDLGKELSDSVYVQALLIVRDCFCQSGQSGVVTVKMNDEIKKINGNQSLEQIKKILADAGGIWATIGDNISAGIPVEYQKSLVLSLIKIFKS
jgi:hypothetical protein